MIHTELYTNPEFFNDGRYAPEFAEWVITTFTSLTPVIQAQHYAPNGTSIGSGRTGRVYEIIDDFGGLSQRRDFGGTVDSKVVEAVTKTIYMGLNSELVPSDYAVEDAVGLREYQRQLQMALARLANTFTYKLFNADQTKIDITDKHSKHNYDYDGFEVFFNTYKDQVMNEVFAIGDVVNNINMKYQVNQYLTKAMKKIDVNGAGANVIYCSEGADVILSSLEANEADYKGEFRFTHQLSTYKGLPKIKIPTADIPEAWRNKGEFVLFSNNSEEFGNHIMLNVRGELTNVRPDVNDGFQRKTPIDMMFAPVLVNKKAASLCFLKEGENEEAVAE